MSNDVFICENLQFAVVLTYLYTWDSLLKIAATDPRNVLFTFDVPSEDAKILWGEYDRGELTVEAKAFVQIYSRVTKKVRDVQKFGGGIWNSPAWVNGKG